jgi:hypothetical protein
LVISRNLAVHSVNYPFFLLLFYIEDARGRAGHTRLKRERMYQSLDNTEALPGQIRMGSSFPDLALCNEFCLVQTNNEDSDFSTSFYIGPNIEAEEMADFKAMRAREDPGCCNKQIFGGNRGWEMDLTQDGVVLATYKRPMTCPLWCGKLCCYQQVTMENPDGSPNGSVMEKCWFCCSPQFSVVKPDGTVEFTMVPDSCKTGMCLLVGCAGLGGSTIDIYSDSSVQVGKVVHGTEKLHKVPWLNTVLWGQKQENSHGLSLSQFRDGRRDIKVDHFAVSFPPEASTDARARILGAVFLINQVFFEPGSAQALCDAACVHTDTDDAYNARSALSFSSPPVLLAEANSVLCPGLCLRCARLCSVRRTKSENEI